MRNFIDLTGKRFGKLLVIKRSGGDSNGAIKWKCICDCGNKRTIISYSLINGITKSCGCSKKLAINLIGQKFGKLTVIGRAKNGKWGVKWKCKCDCGNSRCVYTNSLRRKEGTKSCGCSNGHFKDLTGQRFGKLLAIDIAGKNKGGGYIWNVLCDCGTKKKIWSSNLTQGTALSCGCSRIKTKPGEVGLKILFTRYKNGAKGRGPGGTGLKFTLSLKDFAKLTKMNCNYCNIEPLYIISSKSGKGRNRSKINSQYVYNGIDRVNNSKGYTLSNSITCCGTCNMIKGVMTKQAFLEWVTRIVDFQNSKKSS